MQDIIEQGSKMQFSASEEQLAQEMDREITGNPTPDKIMAALNNLANKYGMSVGQVNSVFTRMIQRDEYGSAFLDSKDEYISTITSFIKKL